ncbi:hypothetical protein [Faecalimicrobium dakarense]|uniref:hypothetical protein n=1 Tax=Faecalimicrobium dakarense TaxID=1301100 RepID=UPI0004ADCAF2|nr:hypothetical protein [[Clostridium] dakarense]
MQLIELKKYAVNDLDKKIINAMIKDDYSTLNKFIGSVICDLIEGVNLDKEYIINAKVNINGYDKISFGEVGTYVALIPYVNSILNSHKDGHVISTTFIEMLISYIIGYTNKDEFIKNLLKMKSLLGISEEFYNGLISYFGLQKDNILSEIDERLVTFS